MENPSGETPLQTLGGSEPTVQVSKAQFEQLLKERDEAKQSLLAANRKIEAGAKFEKFEEFQTSILGEIDTIKSGLSTKDKEIADLKQILTTRDAVTPNISGQPAQAQPKEQVSAEENQARQIFGLPIKS